ncbi:MAG TPA: hypothetical protein VFN56_01885 [Candidatus Saccharimonadales bacterium]|nr:hypothetical protein [Candidatus Saccharimonadales bacterium]
MVAKKNNPSRKKFSLIVLFVLLLLAGAVSLYIIHTKSSAASKVPPAVVHGTPSKPVPHQSNSTPSTALPQGGAIDTNGQQPANTPDSSHWMTSASGNITLQQPYNNQTIQSGAPISGLAKVSSVQFVLTDDTVGLIAQGSLNVVNGQFSGTLHFTAHASHGKIEVYSPNPETGAEENIISAEVNFGS